MKRWKVYRVDDPDDFVVVSYPTHAPMAIKNKAIRESMKLGWGAYPALRVREASAEEAKTLTGNEHWILNCSVDDVNWRAALERLSLEEVDHLLELETRKTARQRLRGRKRRLRGRSEV